MHVVIRLGHPLRVFDALEDARGRTVGHAVVGGARSTSYLRDVSAPSRSVGAQLQPGAGPALLGVPADELAGRHTPLGDLWGRAAADLRERLLAVADPERRLDLFEAALVSRLASGPGLHPAVAHALARFAAAPEVGAVVRESGYSHRHFVALFRRAVGLAPKAYCRVLRLGDAIALAAARPAARGADLALAAGYSDQAHMNREFRALAGLSPGAYREAAPALPHHVPLGR
jgi:AraC-like DNA-binding protein